MVIQRSKTPLPIGWVKSPLAGCRADIRKATREIIEYRDLIRLARAIIEGGHPKFDHRADARSLGIYCLRQCNIGALGADRDLTLKARAIGCRLVTMRQ